MSVAALKGDPSQLAATARAIDPRDHAGRQLAAFYAAGAAYRDGLPISACPFDLVGEADLRACWLRFYDILAKAKRREARVLPKPEVRRVAARYPAAPKQIRTTSAAYAELIGADVAEEGRA